MILKILVGFLLALSAVNAVAGNMYVYKDQDGQVLLTNVTPSTNEPNVIVTEYDENNKVTKVKRYSVSQIRKNTAKSGDYSPEAYKSKLTLIDEKSYGNKRDTSYKISEGLENNSGLANYSKFRNSDSKIK